MFALRSFLSLHRALIVAVAAMVAQPLLLGAQEFTPRLTIHGYLTQAFGMSSKYPTFGLTKDGTADYGRAAILARYEVSPVNHFVVQLAHRRLGDSPTMQFEESVKLDMAFFEHRFSSGTNVRVGKVTMPFGIYNEVRYAGTLTPFYRAPFVIYRDGMYTSETVDGASATHQFRAGEPWAITLDGYGGTFDQLEFGTTYPPASAPVYAGGVLKSKDVLGGQVWLATPLEGLRVGLSGRRQKDLGGIYERPDGANSRIWNASFDGNFERWTLRAERAQMSTYGFAMTAKYVQAGARLLPWLAANAQTEFRDEQLRFTPTGPWFDVKAGRDNALGLNFILSPNAVMKFEAHKTSGFGYMYEQVINTSDPALRGSYFLSSFSVSF